MAWSRTPWPRFLCPGEDDPLRVCLAWSLLLSVGLSLLLGSVPAFALEAGDGDVADVDLRLDAGFDGVVVPGWAPLAVEVRNRGADMAGRLVARARGSNQEVFFEASRDVIISGQAPRRYWLYVYTSEFVQHVEVALLDEAGEPLAAPVASRVFPLERLDTRGSRSPGGLRILVVGQESDQFIAEMRRRKRQHDWLPPVDWEDLPDRAIGYSSVDVMVCLGRDLSASLSPGQVRGLVDWVRAGGRVVLAPPLDTAWFSGAVPQALLPGLETVGLVEIDEFAVLSRVYLDFPAGKASALEVRWPGARVVLSETVKQRRVPLLQERFLGNGSVWLLSCDLRRPPFSNWQRVGDLVADQVLAPILQMRLDGNVLAWQRGEAGSRDLIVNPTLLGAFEGNQDGSLPLILSLLTIYLVLVGPVNRFVLRRCQAEVWSVVTIPALSLVGAVVILGAVYLTKGLGRVVSRVTVLEVRLGERHAWETTVVGVTGSGRFSLAVDMHPRLVGLPVFWDVASARRDGIQMTQGDTLSVVDHPVANWQAGLVLGQGSRELAGAVDVIAAGDGYCLVNGSGLAVVGGLFHDGLRSWSVPAGGPGERITLEPGSMAGGQSLGRRSVIQPGGVSVLAALGVTGGSPDEQFRERQLLSEVFSGFGHGESAGGLSGSGPRLWLRVMGAEPRMGVRVGGQVARDVQVLFGHQRGAGS